MSSDNSLLVQAQGLGKRYTLASSPHQRLWQLLRGQDAQAAAGVRQFDALRDVSLELHRGESLGLIGPNGAGKSTLLQILSGTLTPSSGQMQVNGRVAALLELGAGFNPEFTGRENLVFSAAMYGLQAAQVAALEDEIIDFAGIGQFIDEPVRTYSSGMYVRLAFSIATAVQPDILVIDEALGVGDGAFARKSFERIMQMRERGVTLLFCSHSLFQVEALCQRSLWLHKGQVQALGPSADVIARYNDWLAVEASGASAKSIAPASDAAAAPREAPTEPMAEPALVPATAPVSATVPAGHARLLRLQASSDGVAGTELQARSGQSDIAVDIEFASDPATPCPNLALMVYGADGRVLCSTGNWIDGVVLQRDAAGRGMATVRLPRLPLLKGRYTLSAFLMCERAIHVYEAVSHFATLQVSQPHLEQGIVSIPHEWRAHVPQAQA